VPSTAYVADPVSDVVDDVKDKAADVAKDVSEKVEDAAAKAADVVEDVKDDVTDAAVDVADAAKETTADIEVKLDKLADEAEGGDASPLADSPYGAGSYVGDEPPEGYSIKGNDRSMKYHVPGSAAYERTIAEVWFNTEDAAREAGFVRAQR
jgi:hypothetical protein